MADNDNARQMPNLNEQIKIRREKLATMQAEGKDPFQITKYDVDIHSADAKEKFEQLDASLKAQLDMELDEEAAAEQLKILH